MSMKIMTEGIIIIGSLAISIIAGYFLYTFIEGVRLDMYCKEFREGLDCYQEDWVTIPTWLFSLVGGFVAMLSITLVSIFTPSTRARSSKVAYLVGSILAFPLTFLMVGPIAFLITVLSGLIALLIVLHLTNQGSRTASPPAA